MLVGFEGSNNELQATVSSLRQRRQDPWFDLELVETALNLREPDRWMGGLGGCRLWVGHSDPIGFCVVHSCPIDS